MLGCVALGMDANRAGTALTFSRPGRLQLGQLADGQDAAVDETAAFLSTAGLKVECMGNIRRALWSKFMLNVGINQTCMVYDIPYGPALHQKPYSDDLRQAMREVVVISQAEGIGLNETDLQQAIDLIDTLDPQASPSMRQDFLAGRKTESELFCGTVLEYARRHGIETPVNLRYQNLIHQIEADLA